MILLLSQEIQNAHIVVGLCRHWLSALLLPLLALLRVHALHSRRYLSRPASPKLRADIGGLLLQQRLQAGIRLLHIRGSLSPLLLLEKLLSLLLLLLLLLEP